MARRTEIGASLAAVVLALVTLLAALWLPLVPACQPGAYGSCHARFVALMSVAGRVEPAVWLYIGGMVVLTLTGALGGLLDDGRIVGRGLALLAAGTSLAFGSFALGAFGVFGSLYLPSIVALLIAAVAAWARRQPSPGRNSPRGQQPSE